MDVVSASRIKDRLYAETENNVTILVNKVETDLDKAEVLGRGELQVWDDWGKKTCGGIIMLPIPDGGGWLALRVADDGAVLARLDVLEREGSVA